MDFFFVVFGGKVKDLVYIEGNWYGDVGWYDEENEGNFELFEFWLGDFDEFLYFFEFSFVLIFVFFW